MDHRDLCRANRGGDCNCVPAAPKAIRAACEAPKWCGMDWRTPGIETHGYRIGATSGCSGKPKHSDCSADCHARFCSPACRDARVPPLEAPKPAQHVERMAGQRWRSEKRNLVVVGTLGDRLESGDGWKLIHAVRSDGLLFASCFVDSLWSDSTDTMTLIADAPAQPNTLVSAIDAKYGQSAPCESFQTAGCDGGPYQEHSAECSRRQDIAVESYRKTKPAQEAPKGPQRCVGALGGHHSGAVLERVISYGERIALCDGCYLVDEAFTTRFNITGTPCAQPAGLKPKAKVAADWFEDCLPEAGR